MDPPAPTGDKYVDMVESYLARNVKQNREDDRWTWVRTTDFTSNLIGQCFAYVVGTPGSEGERLNEFMSTTGIYNDRSFKLRMKAGEPYAALQDVVPLLNPKTHPVPFNLLFKINNLVQRGKLSAPTLDDKFFRLVKESSPSAVLYALQAMAARVSTCYEPTRYLKEQMDAHKRGIQPPTAKLEDGTVLIHRLLVTPTKVYCMGPEPETSNRIIRQYEHLSRHFLRVNFVDENCGPLMSSALMSEAHTSRSNVFKRIRLLLKDGFFIGNRKYEFLAFSASQLRDGQLWMYAPKIKVNADVLTADDIRARMGDFSSIRNVAKCAARMGQCFSSSRETRKVLPIQVKRIKDITVTTDSVQYCFSDGIGKISEPFAQEIAADCGLDKGRVPSAFQIRYGGYKGVVARKPRNAREESFKLYLRPSMRKFDSPHFSLEVLEWSKPLPCHLNRQVISLLSTLGVSDSAFLSLQNLAVSKYEHVLDDDAVAMETLQDYGSDSLAVKMLQSGFSSCAEPLLRRLLSVFKDAQLNEIKVKSRIPVEKGRLLMGCLDEMGILQYGEVYVRYSTTTSSGGDDAKTELTVVTDEVFVAKNPCLHPGDIRKLQARDVPELEHMVDCVVFPQCGPR